MTVDPLTRASVLPIWTRPVEPARMEGGLSNISYFVEHDGQKYVVRFGRDLPFHHISRSREIMVAQAAYEAGFGPEIVHTGPGVAVDFLRAPAQQSGDTVARRLHPTAACSDPAPPRDCAGRHADC